MKRMRLGAPQGAEGFERITIPHTPGLADDGDVPSDKANVLLRGSNGSVTSARNLSGLATAQQLDGVVVDRDIPSILLDDANAIAPVFSVEGGLTGTLKTQAIRIGPLVAVFVNMTWTGHAGTAPNGTFTMTGLPIASDNTVGAAWSSSYQVTGVLLHATTADQIPQMRIVAGSTVMSFYTVDQVTGVQSALTSAAFPDAAGSLTFSILYYSELTT